MHFGGVGGCADSNTFVVLSMHLGGVGDCADSSAFVVLSMNLGGVGGCDDSSTFVVLYQVCFPWDPRKRKKSILTSNQRFYPKEVYLGMLRYFMGYDGFIKLLFYRPFN